MKGGTIFELFAFLKSCLNNILITMLFVKIEEPILLVLYKFIDSFIN